MVVSTFLTSRLCFTQGFSRILSPNSTRVVQNVGFKSRYSLDKVYPSSSLDVTVKPMVPQGSQGKFSGYIPLNELKVTHSASSAPGGQNVNKVNTKVDLRFHVASAAWIPEQVRPKILEKYQSLVNKDGYLILKSEKTRLQMLNLADCLDKLRYIIRESEAEPIGPSPEDETLRLERHEAACRARLRFKRSRSSIKEGRMNSTMED